MSKVITEVNSTVNELFAKSIVTQKFSNPTDNPIELKIYIIKNDKLLFSSFKCKIGDNIEVKSKVIKKEKAEVKYTDSIASGNAAIFVSQDPENENNFIILGFITKAISYKLYLLSLILFINIWTTLVP